MSMNTILFISADWAIIALSFFNTMTLIWLGVTVLLNGEKRRWGTWVAAGGLLCGGIVFAVHSAVVGRIIGPFDGELQFWWKLVWVPIIGVPYFWYLLMVWYTNVLRTRQHKIWLLITSVLGISALSLLLLLDAFPAYQDVFRERGSIPAFQGIPLLAIIYPIYSVLCFLLSISSLAYSDIEDNPLEHPARGRARPWLIAVSVVLFLMSLCFGFIIGWLLRGVETGQLRRSGFLSLSLLMGLDLVICGLVAIATILIGRSITSYEVFGKRILPSGGVRHHWQSSLILAACYSSLLAWGLEFDIEPIYRLLLLTILITVLYALFSWRTYTYRERSMSGLRPFVTSQQVYETLLKPTLPDVDATEPLHALCRDVLHAKVAYLIPLGPMAPFVGSVLTYPASPKAESNGHPPDSPASEYQPRPDDILPPMNTLVQRFHSPHLVCVPLDPIEYGGAVWAVPLWGQRGLIGVLLLGAKENDDIYTQEEMDIARAIGERLIDTQASVEMARRLMALQRKRLTESQVLDRQTRRILHDDVLPKVHTAMITLSSTPMNDNITNVVNLLTQTHQQIATLLHTMPTTAAPEVSRLGLLGALRRMIETELARQFDHVVWEVDSATEAHIKALPALAAEVLFYAARESVRNAARYARLPNGARPLTLTIRATWRHGGLELVVEDDGVGMGSTRPSGEQSGHGLALHSTMMAVIGGTMTVDSVQGSYTRVTLALPHGAGES